MIFNDLSFNAFAQKNETDSAIYVGTLGIINDKDGFVNVRHEPKIGNNVIDSIFNNEVFRCIEIKGNWCHIEYWKDKVKTGYIYKSKAKSIFVFDNIPFRYIKGSTAFL